MFRIRRKFWRIKRLLMALVVCAMVLPGCMSLFSSKTESTQNVYSLDVDSYAEEQGFEKPEEISDEAYKLALRAMMVTEGYLSGERGLSTVMSDIASLARVASEINYSISRENGLVKSAIQLLNSSFVVSEGSDMEAITERLEQLKDMFRPAGE